MATNDSTQKKEPWMNWGREGGKTRFKQQIYEYSTLSNSNLVIKNETIFRKKSYYLLT